MEAECKPSQIEVKKKFRSKKKLKNPLENFTILLTSSDNGFWQATKAIKPANMMSNFISYQFEQQRQNIQVLFSTLPLLLTIENEMTRNKNIG